MMESLRKFLWCVKAGVTFAPVWISEHKLRSEIKPAVESVVAPSEKWLDVGCGLRPYESYFPAGSYVGVDIEANGCDPHLKTPDHYYGGRVLPFSDNSFGGVISTQVLEHAPSPRSLLIEMRHVIRPG
ncbi:MAG: class I SAM-dependent methyltransferase [Nitrosomonadaceae bacterium]|nr:class I SAM-dependent methyltransferase [Nitrosomonadaceae bacterium]